MANGAAWVAPRPSLNPPRHNKAPQGAFQFEQAQMTGILLKVDRIPFEDGLHLIQYLRLNGFEVVDVNTQRPAQVRLAIETIRQRKKIPALVDVIDEYKSDANGDVQILGNIYPVLDVTETDETKTLSLIQEVLGVIAHG